MTLLQVRANYGLEMLPTHVGGKFTKPTTHFVSRLKVALTRRCSYAVCDTAPGGTPTRRLASRFGEPTGSGFTEGYRSGMGHGRDGLGLSRLGELLGGLLQLRLKCCKLPTSLIQFFRFG